MFVYAAANPAMPGLIKIGKAGNVEERLADLSRSTVMPFPFRLVASARTSNNDLAEALLHGTFAAFRVAHNREFFRVDESAVICAFKLLEITAAVAPILSDDTVETNVVRFNTRSGGDAVIEVLREAGRPLSNRELARLMNCCDGEATKRRREVAEQIAAQRVGREVLVSLIERNA